MDAALQESLGQFYEAYIVHERHRETEKRRLTLSHSIGGQQTGTDSSRLQVGARRDATADAPSELLLKALSTGYLQDYLPTP